MESHWGLHRLLASNHAHKHMRRRCSMHTPVEVCWDNCSPNKRHDDGTGDMWESRIGHAYTSVVCFLGGGRGEDERWSECTHDQGLPGWGFMLLGWPVTKRSGAAQQLHDAGTASCLLTR